MSKVYNEEEMMEMTKVTSPGWEMSNDNSGELIIYTGLFQWNDCSYRTTPDPDFKDAIRKTSDMSAIRVSTADNGTVITVNGKTIELDHDGNLIGAKEKTSTEGINPAHLPLVLAFCSGGFFVIALQILFG